MEAQISVANISHVAKRGCSDSSTPVSADSLCNHCGLCCSGELFSHRYLAPEELNTVQRIRWHMAGVKLILKEEDWCFQLPCGAFQKGACGCYATRPQTCSKFDCHLLRRVAAKNIDMNRAADIIDEARRRIQALSDHLRKYPKDKSNASFDERLRDFHQWFSQLHPSDRYPYRHIQLAQRALWEFFDEHFY